MHVTRWMVSCICTCRCIIIYTAYSLPSQTVVLSGGPVDTQGDSLGRWKLTMSSIFWMLRDNPQSLSLRSAGLGNSCSVSIVVTWERRSLFPNTSDTLYTNKKCNAGMYIAKYDTYLQLCINRHTDTHIRVCIYMCMYEIYNLMSWASVHGEDLL